MEDLQEIADLIHSQHKMMQNGNSPDQRNSRSPSPRAGQNRIRRLSIADAMEEVNLQLQKIQAKELEGHADHGTSQYSRSRPQSPANRSRYASPNRSREASPNRPGLHNSPTEGKRRSSPTALRNRRSPCGSPGAEGSSGYNSPVNVEGKCSLENRQEFSKPRSVSPSSRRRALPPIENWDTSPHQHHVSNEFESQDASGNRRSMNQSKVLTRQTATSYANAEREENACDKIFLAAQEDYDAEIAGICWSNGKLSSGFDLPSEMSPDSNERLYAYTRSLSPTVPRNFSKRRENAGARYDNLAIIPTPQPRRSVSQSKVETGSQQKTATFPHQNMPPSEHLEVKADNIYRKSESETDVHVADENQVVQCNSTIANHPNELSVVEADIGFGACNGHATGTNFYLMAEPAVVGPEYAELSFSELQSPASPRSLGVLRQNTKEALKRVKSMENVRPHRHHGFRERDLAPLADVQIRTRPRQSSLGTYEHDSNSPSSKSSSIRAELQRKRELTRKKAMDELRQLQSEIRAFNQGIRQSLRPSVGDECGQYASSDRPVPVKTRSIQQKLGEIERVENRAAEAVNRSELPNSYQKASDDSNWSVHNVVAVAANTQSAFSHVENSASSSKTESLTVASSSSIKIQAGLSRQHSRLLAQDTAEATERPSVKFDVPEQTAATAAADVSKLASLSRTGSGPRTPPPLRRGESNQGLLETFKPQRSFRHDHIPPILSKEAASAAAAARLLHAYSRVRLMSVFNLILSLVAIAAGVFSPWGILSWGPGIFLASSSTLHLYRESRKNSCSSLTNRGPFVIFTWGSSIAIALYAVAGIVCVQGLLAIAGLFGLPACPMTTTLPSACSTIPTITTATATATGGAGNDRNATTYASDCLGGSLSVDQYVARLRACRSWNMCNGDRVKMLPCGAMFWLNVWASAVAFLSCVLLAALSIWAFRIVDAEARTLPKLEESSNGAEGNDEESVS